MKTGMDDCTRKKVGLVDTELTSTQKTLFLTGVAASHLILSGLKSSRKDTTSKDIAEWNKRHRAEKERRIEENRKIYRTQYRFFIGGDDRFYLEARVLRWWIKFFNRWKVIEGLIFESIDEAVEEKMKLEEENKKATAVECRKATGEI